MGKIQGGRNEGEDPSSKEGKCNQNAKVVSHRIDWTLRVCHAGGRGGNIMKN